MDHTALLPISFFAIMAFTMVVLCEALERILANYHEIDETVSDLVNELAALR